MASNANNGVTEQWCQSELSTCPIICQQVPPGGYITNTCDAVSLVEQQMPSLFPVSSLIFFEGHPPIRLRLLQRPAAQRFRVLSDASLLRLSRVGHPVPEGLWTGQRLLFCVHSAAPLRCLEPDACQQHHQRHHVRYQHLHREPDLHRPRWQLLHLEAVWKRRSSLA